jgi:plastocyanin
MLVLPLTLLAACGGDTARAPAPKGPQTVTVELREFSVKPSTTHIRPGRTIFKAVNKGTIPHELEIEGPGTESETPVIQPGESISLELQIRFKGKWQLACPLDGHEKKGMLAHFTVG